MWASPLPLKITSARLFEERVRQTQKSSSSPTPPALSLQSRQGMVDLRIYCGNIMEVVETSIGSQLASGEIPESWRESANHSAVIRFEVKRCLALNETAAAAATTIASTTNYKEKGGSDDDISIMTIDSSSTSSMDSVSSESIVEHQDQKKPRKKNKKIKLSPSQKTLRGFVATSWPDSDSESSDDTVDSQGSNWSDDMKKKENKKRSGKSSGNASAKRNDGGKKTSSQLKQGRLGSFLVSNNAVAKKSSKSKDGIASKEPAANFKRPYAIGTKVVVRNLTSNAGLNGKGGKIKSKVLDCGLRQEVDLGNGQIFAIPLENLRGFAPLFM